MGEVCPSMIQPVLQGKAFLTDVEIARKEKDGFRLWWLGQSGYLLQWQNQHLLLDPYLSDSLTKKYFQTDKPHIRMTEIVVSPYQLNFIDGATSSHNHTDHLDGETLIPLMEVNSEIKIIVPTANKFFASQRLQTSPENLIGLNDNQSTAIGGFQVSAVPSAHEELEQDKDGNHRYLGYLIEFDDWTVYHSGDTMLYDGIVDILKSWSIDVALLPINGSVPARRVSGNLDGKEAVELAKSIGAKLVIPCHYQMFTFNTVSTELFVKSAETTGQAYQLLQAGERWTSDQLPSRV